MTFDRGAGAVLDHSSSDGSIPLVDNDVTSGATVLRSGSTARETGSSARVSGVQVAAPRPAPGREGDGTRSVRLTHQVLAVREARAAIVADLHERGIDLEIIDEAESVVAELVGNAIRHARPLADGCVRVRWKVKAGAVEVEVRDGGSDTEPRPARPSPLAMHGRGLRIVRSMAHEWGVLDEGNGRTVWAALGGPSRRRAG